MENQVIKLKTIMTFCLRIYAKISKQFTFKLAKSYEIIKL